MIKGFEEYTVELTEHEEAIARKTAAKLRLSIGKQNAVTNKQIKAFFSANGVELGEARIRKIIQFIRQNHLVKRLCANSKGYFVAATQQELDDYIESLQQRRNSIDFTLQCLRS